MKNIAAVLLFVLGLATPVSALSLDDIPSFSLSNWMVDSIDFVAATEIPAQGDGMMALCHRSRGFTVLGYPLTSEVYGYVLVSDECKGTELRAFSSDQMATAQSLNLIDASLPAEARTSFERNVQTYGVIVGIALIMLVVIWRRIKALFGLDPNAQMRKRAANRILSALCHAAKCDGLVSSVEVKLISRTMKRLTKRSYSPAEITRISDRVHINLPSKEYIAFGKGLRDYEKDIMLQGVLYITMAGDRMLPAEYKFATELSHGLGMPAEDFRRVLYLAFADKEANPA